MGNRILEAAGPARHEAEPDLGIGRIRVELDRKRQLPRRLAVAVELDQHIGEVDRVRRIVRIEDPGQAESVGRVRKSAERKGG